MFLSFASPYAAQVSKLMGRVHVAFDDTEHAKIAHKLYRPFTDRIFVSKFYLGERTQRMQEYDGLIELSYLHPDYFEPDPLIFDLLGIEQDEKFVFLRFISWGAHHDVGQKGISEEVKLKAVRELRQHAKVFISSESELPEELKPYQLKIPPHMIHHVLYYSSLYFGESGTMATEAAILGTPTIRVSTLAKLLGNFKELSEKYNLLEFYDSDEKGLKRALELVRDEGSKAAWKKRSEAFVKEKVDVVAFMLANITKVEKNG